MNCNINSNITIEEAIKFVEEKRLYLQELTEVKDIKKAFADIYTEFKNIFISKEILDKLEINMIYQENIYSKERTKKSINQTNDKVIKYLDRVLIELKHDNNDILTENIVICILKKIMINFYKHIEVMYEEPVHGKAGITNDMLSKIKILNEYDVQRILYSLIKPIFPSARVEVSNDTGFSTIRYDIFIEDYSTVIEVKCSRTSMTEKKLTEEIGSDIFHYKYNNIFFFVYDKEKIIKNIDAFSSTYNGKFGNKNINTIIIQPILL